MIGLVDGNNFFVSCERVFDRRLVGRPVAVLSNNDGCCVSRSNEFKALGIPMGTPYFQLKHREASGELCFCSSNYELYGDMSRRIISILREEAVDVEQYSIDEAFIFPPTTAAADYIAYGRRVRAKILRWVGIPCGVGFAPTKTLAKIANHIGKKRPDGVFLMPDDPTEILAALPVQEVWGVGRRLPLKLRAERILTAQHLRDAPDATIRSIGGVTLLRTAMELRGVPCHEERDYDADPDSISCSRSFGEPATTAEALAESLAAYTAQAAAKLRRHGLLAAGCNIYAQVHLRAGFRLGRRRRFSGAHGRFPRAHGRDERNAPRHPRGGGRALRAGDALPQDGHRVLRPRKARHGAPDRPLRHYAASREVAPVRRRGRPQRALRQGQGILRRPGAGREVVAHETAEAFAPPDHAVGRADDGQVTL